ncbi:hypothetical protein BC831DRAFT_160479 [Entophlyctis helioformis]|nr:hypothetical protein BC831DRAFT_160479 [Entophlyctis helioformis]
MATYNNTNTNNNGYAYNSNGGGNNGGYAYNGNANYYGAYPQQQQQQQPQQQQQYYGNQYAGQGYQQPVGGMPVKQQQQQQAPAPRDDYRRMDSMYGPPADPFAEPAAIVAGPAPPSAPSQQPQSAGAASGPVAYTAAPQQSYIPPPMTGEAVTISRPPLMPPQPAYGAQAPSGYANPMYGGGNDLYGNNGGANDLYGNQYGNQYGNVSPYGADVYGNNGNNGYGNAGNSNGYNDRLAIDTAGAGAGISRGASIKKSRYEDPVGGRPLTPTTPSGAGAGAGAGALGSTASGGRSRMDAKYDDGYDPSAKSYLDLDDGTEKRYMRFWRSKRGFYICAGVTSFVLIVLAVVGFFFFPRYVHSLQCAPVCASLSLSVPACPSVCMCCAMALTGS